MKNNNLQFEKDLDFNNQGDKKEENSKYVIEYFDKQKFHEFLISKNTYPDGILQKFIDPKGDNNFIIRLIWSPKLCVLEKKINTKRIYDSRYNIYERAVTYDGEEFQTETEAIRGNNIPDRFEKIGNNIANHISNITLERIKIIRMILNFRIDKNDRFYFLWCSSLRIENNLERKFTTKKEKNITDLPFITNCDIEKMSVTYPNSVNLFQYSKQGKPIKVDKSIFCKNCDLKVEPHKMCDILFRTLVEAHESRKRDKNYNKLFENINIAANGVELLPYIPNKGENENKLEVLKNYKNLLIPKVIFALFPRLNYEDYYALKKDIVFLSKKTQICEKCFLDMTSYCNFSGANTENLLRVLKSNIPEETITKNLNNYRRKKHENSKEKNAFNNFNKTNIHHFQTVKNFNINNKNNNYNSSYNKLKSKINPKTQINYFKNNDYNNKNNLLNKDKDFTFDRFKPDFSSNIKFLKEPKSNKIEIPFIKEKEEKKYEKQYIKEKELEIGIEQNNNKKIYCENENENDYDIQSPLIEVDLKKAENYLNFLDDKINEIIKESNFDKSNIENENDSMMEKSGSEKVSFLDNSKSKSNIVYSKEKNESFKEYSSRYSSGNKIKSLKQSDIEREKEIISKSGEDKVKESESDDGFDNDSVEENLCDNLNDNNSYENNKENRVPVGIEILDFEKNSAKSNLILKPDLGSIETLSKEKSKIIMDEDIDQMEVNMEDMEIEKSNTSKKSMHEIIEIEKSNISKKSRHEIIEVEKDNENEHENQNITIVNTNENKEENLEILNEANVNAADQ